MKRFFGLIMSLVLLAAAVSPAWAQTSRSRYRRYDNSRQVYYDQRYNNRSIWDQSRDKITVAAGTGVGAVIGGLAGGRTGAVIGALLGAGGSALYTYKLRDRNDRRYYRRR
jgi:outer membrane lipoprotein SlyB